MGIETEGTPEYKLTGVSANLPKDAALGEAGMVVGNKEAKAPD